MSGSYGRYMFSLRSCQIFLNSCTSLYAHEQCMDVPSLHFVNTWSGQSF